MTTDSVPIPFSEPPWLLGMPSPIFKPSHYAWQKAIRAFITENLSKNTLEWEKEGTVPPHVLLVEPQNFFSFHFTLADQQSSPMEMIRLGKQKLSCLNSRCLLPDIINILDVGASGKRQDGLPRIISAIINTISPVKPSPPPTCSSRRFRPHCQ